MALVREQSKPKEREKHVVIPVHGEWGRYTINSRSAAKKGQDEVYIVDVLEEHVHNDGEKVIGVCPCKGFQVRRKCSHLDDAREYHETIAAQKKAADLGFERVSDQG